MRWRSVSAAGDGFGSLLLSSVMAPFAGTHEGKKFARGAENCFSGIDYPFFLGRPGFRLSGGATSLIHLRNVSRVYA